MDINPKPLRSSTIASFHLSRPLVLNPCRISTPKPHDKPNPQLFFLQPFKTQKLNPLRASAGGNGAAEKSKKPPLRRGRKKASASSSKPKKTTTQIENGSAEPELGSESELEDYDDGIDFPYDDPPLVCCFGSARKEYIPTVRVSDNPMHPDIYSQWKMLQWDPPEFSHALGSSPSNVAISHVRLSGRAAFMGKVDGDEFGSEELLTMNKENVQTRGVKVDGDAKTARTYKEVA